MRRTQPTSTTNTRQVFFFNYEPQVNVLVEWGSSIRASTVFAVKPLHLLCLHIIEIFHSIYCVWIHKLIHPSFELCALDLCVKLFSSDLSHGLSLTINRFKNSIHQFSKHLLLKKNSKLMAKEDFLERKKKKKGQQWKHYSMDNNMNWFIDSGSKAISLNLNQH